MANALYDTGRAAFLTGGIAAGVDTIKVALLNSSYTPDLAAHQYKTSISTYIVGTPQTLSVTSTTAGTLKGSNVTFTAVTTGSTITYIALYKDTGNALTSQLIGLIDTATNMPLPSNGGDITVQWDAAGIFTL